MAERRRGALHAAGGTNSSIALEMDMVVVTIDRGEGLGVVKRVQDWSHVTLISLHKVSK
jgi:hypothetical protein